MLLVLVALGITAGSVGFTYYYVKYSRIIDEKLRVGPFIDTSKIYAASKAVSVGDKMSPEELIDRLRRAGFGDSSSNRVGWYHVRPDAVEIIPGRPEENGRDRWTETSGEVSAPLLYSVLASGGVVLICARSRARKIQVMETPST